MAEVTHSKASQKLLDPNALAPILEEIPRRYVEQIQTTVETMRRRGISIYDGAFRLTNRTANLIEKTREHVEPLAYDAKDFVVGAVNNTQPLNEKDRDLRNNLLEMYLGTICLFFWNDPFQFGGELKWVFDLFFYRRRQKIKGFCKF